MDFYFTGIIIAVSTFLIIGIFHPIVIKVEYYIFKKEEYDAKKCVFVYY